MLSLNTFQRLGVILALIIDCSCECPKAKFTNATTDFGFKLLRSSFANTNENMNVVLSPTGVSTLLAIVYSGAGGKTAEELSTLLNYTDSELNRIEAVLACQRNILDDPQNNSTAFDVADVILVRSNVTILQNYRKTVLTDFATEIVGVNFEKAGAKVVSDTNDLVAERTSGKITNIIGGELGADDQMVLLNAAYFNGSLKMPSTTSYSAQLPFYTEGIHLTSAETIVCTGPMLYTSETGLNSQVVELPHTDGRHSLGIVLPHTKRGLSNLTHAMDARSFAEMRKNLKPVTVSLTLPRFNFTTTWDLAGPLIRLGAASLFSDADLTGITSDKGLRVTEMRHKARIEVTEERAVSPGGGAIAAPKAVPVFFHARHPFLFYVLDHRTQRTILVGLVQQL
ncbi:intracellular coagulation inhibitor 3-like [Ixodes scapularis]|uniref:intracellular coagulation inhibitor 3-like n=1 Tax=Ixodes scapularis TaxID=6945 RepID=UPI001C382679|nr:intracellular coagulation inhibitor 3-like [Ixodes scapularis]